MPENEKEVNILKNSKLKLSGKIVLTVLLSFVGFYLGPFIFIILLIGGIWEISTVISLLIVPLIIPFIWLEKRISFLYFGSLSRRGYVKRR